MTRKREKESGKETSRRASTSLKSSLECKGDAWDTIREAKRQLAAPSLRSTFETRENVRARARNGEKFFEREWASRKRCLARRLHYNAMYLLVSFIPRKREKKDSSNAKKSSLREIKYLVKRAAPNITARCDGNGTTYRYYLLTIEKYISELFSHRFIEIEIE